MSEYERRKIEEFNRIDRERRRIEREQQRQADQERFDRQMEQLKHIAQRQRISSHGPPVQAGSLKENQAAMHSESALAPVEVKPRAPRKAFLVRAAAAVALLFLIAAVISHFSGSSGGHDMTASQRPADYARNLLENSLALRKVPDPVTNTREAYDIMVRLLGEGDVLKASAEMQDAGHDRNGALSAPLRVNSPVVLDAHDAHDPLLAFTALVTSYDDRGYAIGTCLGTYYPQYAELWRGAERSYTALVQSYGEKPVLAAAARVRTAPKMEDGTLTDLSGIKDTARRSGCCGS